MELSVFSFLQFENIFRIALIVVVAIFARLFVALFLNAFIRKSSRASAGRIRTLSSLAAAVSSTIIWLITLIIILKEIGFDVTPIIASAGVIGVAVAFGSQTLVKDILSGFFLLIENQFAEGEEIVIADKKGVVEKATLRTITIREKDGSQTTIPYSAITIVNNRSRGQND